jgi:hypothetical protein
MKKEDFQVGMIVRFAADRFGPDKMPRGVIIKINPKRAKVKSLDPAGKWGLAGIWNCSYSGLVPVVGGEEVSNEMTMRSFEKPDDQAVKTWSTRQKKQREISRAIKPEDRHIIRAIDRIYDQLEKDSASNLDTRDLSCKIHLLFRAIGRDISKEEAAERVREFA